MASQKVWQENHLKNANTYLRASEFLIAPDDESKIPTYNKFIQLFDKAYSNENFERHKVEYNGSFYQRLNYLAKIQK